MLQVLIPQVQEQLHVKHAQQVHIQHQAHLHEQIALLELILRLQLDLDQLDLQVHTQLVPQAAVQYVLEELTL